MQHDNPYSSPHAQLGRARGSEPEFKGLGWLLFSFEGRIPRRTWWGFNFASLGFSILIALILILGIGGGRAPQYFLLIYLVVQIPAIYAGLAVTVKRWHDRDKSGWWIFITLVPLIGGIWHFIETGCLRGTEGPNNYGEDPT